MWQWIALQQGCFTTRQMVDATGEDYQTGIAFIAFLQRKGIVDHNDERPRQWLRVKTPALTFGRGGRVGRRRRRTRRLNGAWRCWRTVRVLHEFTTADVAQGADVGQQFARKWVALLHRAGYLKLVRQAQPGNPSMPAHYLLIRNSGPKSPIHHREDKTIYDPNLDKTFTTEDRRNGRVA